MKNRARPWVLGIGSSHNGAVCLLHGDEIVVAIQEERLVRFKRAEHPAGLASLAIRYCLDYAGITPADLSAVGVCGLEGDTARDDVHLNPQLRTIANDVAVMRLTHHMGHAVGAFATSGFRAAAVLVVDGNGTPWTALTTAERDCVIAPQRRTFDAADPTVCESISTYAASGTSVTPLEKQVGQRTRLTERSRGMVTFFSLGRLFENVGWQIFGDPLEGPGKVMGLAPYGRPTLPPEAFFDIVDDEIVFRDDVPNQYRHEERWPLRQGEYADLAASVQAALERALLWLVKRLRASQAADRLCYAGGVALNSVANERLVREGGFREVYIMPAAEDSGTAVGAAYFALWTLTGCNGGARLEHDAVGRAYDDREVRNAIDRREVLRAERVPNVAARAAQLLADGKVIGWYRGRSELGPRALGQRSILADPRDPGMKDRLNSRVKFRELFRPYAPIVLLEHATEWFDVAADDAESPFMLRVMSFRPPQRARVPAVVHVDGTGRVQTVTKAMNPTLHALLTAFHERTGVPILLNTSFNTAGEPIVETPDDALSCFLLTELDACILENYVVEKPPRFGSMLDWYPTLSCEWLATEYCVEPHRTDWTLRTVHRGLFRSAAEGRAAELTALANRHRLDVVRLVVDGPWGRVVHVASADVLPLLCAIDGERTGWDLFKALSDGDSEVSLLWFRRALAQLARTGVIACRPFPVRRFAHAVAAR